MSLELNSKCIAALEEAVLNALKEIKVNNGKYVDSQSASSALSEIDKILPQGKKGKQIESYINEEPFAEFVTSKIRNLADEYGEYDSNTKSSPLTSLSPFKDQDDVAKIFVEMFNSLPWHYTLSFELPPKIAKKLYPILSKPLVLARNVRLIRADETFSEEFPRNSVSPKANKRVQSRTTLSLLLLGDNSSEQKWSEGSCYLQVQAKGFVDPYGTTIPAQEAIQIMKAVYGVGMAEGFFKNKYEYFPTSPQYKVYVHQRYTKGWNLEEIFKLSEEYTKTLASLEINEAFANSSEEELTGLMRYFAKKTQIIWESPKGMPLINAAQWLFDSYSGHDDLLRFVRTMIALEILLGDKSESEKVGLKELLKNRCAYMIGNDVEERESIMKDFEHIYDVRSQIVHRGKARLSSKEWELFSKLRWFCIRVIGKEIELLSPKKDR